MPLVRVAVKKCIQDSQEYGSNDEEMISRVFFSIYVDGVLKGEYHADIKQIVGSTYSSDNIEVTRPQNYAGPFNHELFSDKIAGYFSKLVNSSGSMISLGGAKNIRMINNTFIMPYEFQFEAEQTGASW